MARKIIFLDVDGTLTLPTGKVSDKVQYAIEGARNNGHYVFLCTGRNKTGVKSLLSIGFDGVICSAGGYIEINGEKIYESFLSDEDLKIAIDVFDRNHVMYNLEATDMTFQDENMNKEFAKHQIQSEKMNSEMIRMMNEQKDMFNIHSMEEYYENPLPIHKICFMSHDEKNLVEPRDVLKEKYNFIIHDLFSKDTINGEIIIKDTNKGNAVKCVVERLGLSLADTIGFGDSMNDYQMLEEVEIGVVYKGASDQLKKLGKYYFDDPDQDGIYKVMKEIGLIDN